MDIRAWPLDQCPTGIAMDGSIVSRPDLLSFARHQRDGDVLGTARFISERINMIGAFRLVVDVRPGARPQPVPVFASASARKNKPPAVVAASSATSSPSCAIERIDFVGQIEHHSVAVGVGFEYRPLLDDGDLVAPLPECRRDPLVNFFSRVENSQRVGAVLAFAPRGLKYWTRRQVTVSMR